MSPHVLVIGGQRSGKSRYAEDLVAKSSPSPVYIATATAGDAEMAERIKTHRSRRGARWRTVEEPLELPRTVASVAEARTAVLVDCLTLWLSNSIEAGRDPVAETERLVEALSATRGPVVLVSNEVGSGIIPTNQLARRYADALGVLNQRVAAVVGRVVLLAAGLPVLVKPTREAEMVL